MSDCSGSQLLDRIVVFVRRFVVLSDVQALELALWITHAHAFKAAEATPYQNIHSAEKECGKTRLLEVLELLVPGAWLTGRVTAAALVRKIHYSGPTLLLDESDAAFGRDKEYAEALREVLNMGHRKGGKATLCTGQGANLATTEFDVFCPKAIAGIGKLPDTVAGRSVPIRLKRKAPGEGVERFRWRKVVPEANELRAQVARWAQANLKILRDAQPELPDALSDRQQDGAEPLLAIADLAGGDWPSKARSALVELWNGAAAEDDSIRVRLLADVQRIFEEKQASKLPSGELVGDLVDIEGAPWAEWNHGKLLTTNALAKLLKPFEISPRTIRIGNNTPKGYTREQFEDAWSRYLRSEPQHPQQSSTHKAEMQISQAQQTISVAVEERGTPPMQGGLVAGVALAPALSIGNQDFEEGEI